MSENPKRHWKWFVLAMLGGFGLYIATQYAGRVSPSFGQFKTYLLPVYGGLGVFGFAGLGWSTLREGNVSLAGLVGRIVFYLPIMVVPSLRKNASPLKVACIMTVIAGIGLTTFAARETLGMWEHHAFFEASQHARGLVGDPDMLVPNRRASCQRAVAVCESVEADYPNAPSSCRLRVCNPERVRVEEALIAANQARSAELCGAALRDARAERLHLPSLGAFCRYSHGD